MRHPRLAAATLTTVVALVTLGGAAPALASSGTLEDYHPQGSACGQYHGAFSYFGKDNNMAGGADGQATGAANSAKGCQNNL
jgi:hypothetical protein